MKICYKVMVVTLNSSPLAVNFVKAARRIWASQVPSKVHVFGCRFLQGRLATRDQLVSRGIIDPVHFTCPFCFHVDERVSHIFFDF